MGIAHREASNACPRCESRRLVHGELTGESDGVTFRANAARLPSLRIGVDVARGARACSECGLVWSVLSPEELDEHLARFQSTHVANWRLERPNRPL
jgi:hypothetical protein